jgi:hypothetical protein
MTVDFEPSINKKLFSRLRLGDYKAHGLAPSHVTYACQKEVNSDLNDIGK